MPVTRSHTGIHLRRKESGFTLPEILVTIVILTIIFAVAVPTWQSLGEARRVDSATMQFAADLRLAHGKASNQLAAWRVELNPDRGSSNAGADYSLVQLDPSGNVIASSRVSRTLPDNTLLNSATLLPLGGTTAIEFFPNGSASAVGTLNLGAASTDGCLPSTPSGPRIRVTVNGNSPLHCVTFSTATSRVKVD